MTPRPTFIAIAGTALITLFAACALPHDQTSGDGDAGPIESFDASGSSSGTGSSSGPGGGSSGTTTLPMATSVCRAGPYRGTLAGHYVSDVDSGSPVPVEANVELTLNQEGTSEEMCQIEVLGEGVTTERCSDVFTVSGGTITGAILDDADSSAGGTPFSCTVTGVLDCSNRVLDDGWIQCSYCGGLDAGPCPAGAGRFAGPLQALYDANTLTFTGGSWNGAENLAGNDGGSPGPEGGSPLNYLVLDGGYGDGTFGGSGTWGASCPSCP